MTEWTDREWLTLQLGPVWVLSAITGRSHFDELETLAFWRAVEDAPEHGVLSWKLTSDMTRNRGWLLEEFPLDERSIVSGLSQVALLLERTPADESRETRAAMLRIGISFARARGPFGQRISDQDDQTLLLLSQLLETPAETARDNPLNAATAT